MPNTLHITNGDSTVAGMRAGGIEGEILPWRDALHEGPVPPEIPLDQLSQRRATWLASEGLSSRDTAQSGFAERDDLLRRYCDYDEVVLWFEWDLYDQLQLIQILDFFSSDTSVDRSETGTRLCLVGYAGYLGSLESEFFASLYESRGDVTDEIIASGRDAWGAFRSTDPHNMARIAGAENLHLQFLPLAFARQLEELPSTVNGLSRSESQILEAVAQGPLPFHEIFGQCANREERIFCGDAILARYIQRMSRRERSLIRYTSGDVIAAPRGEDDSRAFRNAEMGLTADGRAVLAGEKDWIEMGGSDRWLGGIHLDGSRARWRWNQETRAVAFAGESDA